MIDGMDLLRKAVAATNCEEVAQEMGISRAAVSLAVRGKYPAKTDRIALRALTRYARVACPFLEEEITFAVCREHHTANAPTSSAFAMRHWKACQRCPNRKEP